MVVINSIYTFHVERKQAHNCVMLTQNYAFGPINDLNIILLT